MQGVQVMQCPQGKIFHYYYCYLLTFAVVSPWCRVRVLLKYFFIMTVICSPLQWCLRGAACTGGAMPPGKNISLLLLLSTHFCSGVSMVQGRVLLKYFFIMTVICSPLQWCLRGAGCTGGARPPGRSCRGGS